MLRWGWMLGLAAMAATPVVASERTAVRAIVSGEWRMAEQTLVAERRIFPDRPELMLNLAAVYAETQRPDAARALYAQVLAHPPVAMDMASGVVSSSHDVARLGLGRLEDTTILAAR